MNKELEILKDLKQIMNRLDEIEEKIDQLNDPYNLNDYFRSQNNRLPNDDSIEALK